MPSVECSRLPQGRSTGATPGSPRSHFVQQRAWPALGDSRLKALPDHSFMCHSPQNAPTFVGPHDNRLVGDTEKGSETLVRADTSVADSGEMAGRTTHQLQDTE